MFFLNEGFHFTAMKNTLILTYIGSHTISSLRIAKALSEAAGMEEFLEERYGDDGWPKLQKDKFIFEETRKILIAEYQHILYSEYLPKVIGPDYMREFKMRESDRRGRNNRGSTYRPRTNPSIINEFATFSYSYLRFK